MKIKKKKKRAASTDLGLFVVHRNQNFRSYEMNPESSFIKYVCVHAKKQKNKQTKKTRKNIR